MTSVYSGVSRFAFRYAVSNFMNLLKVSAVPFAIILCLSAIYMYSYMERVLGIMAQNADAQKVVAQIGYQWTDFLYLLSVSFFSMWLIAKVVRLVLTEESPSLIGSGGTLRSAFWLLIYYVGSVLLVLLPLFLVALVIGVVIGVIVGMGQAGAAILGPVLGLVTILFFAWAMCRFLIGFQPVALGVRSNFFLGWRLTRGASWGLFFRVVGAGLIVLLVSLVFWRFLGGGVMETVMSSATGIAVNAERPSADDISALARNAALGQVVMSAFFMPVQWFFFVMFAESYRRLSAG